MSVKELTAEQAWQLADLEAMGPGPFFLHPVVADACLAEYGRLPSNFVVTAHFPAPAPMPAVVPAMPQHRGAQWKREQAGRCS